MWETSLNRGNRKPTPHDINILPLRVQDLKPENLMLVKPPRNGNIQDVAIKLVDFGIAKMIPGTQ